MRFITPLFAVAGFACAACLTRAPMPTAAELAAMNSPIEREQQAMMKFMVSRKDSSTCGVVYGRAVDAVTLQPDANASLVLTDSVVSNTAYTDAQGNFRVAVPGQRFVWVKQGYDSTGATRIRAGNLPQTWGHSMYVLTEQSPTDPSRRIIRKVSTSSGACARAAGE